MTDDQYQIFDLEPKSPRYKDGVRYALNINGHLSYFTPETLIEFRNYVNEFVAKRVRK